MRVEGCVEKPSYAAQGGRVSEDAKDLRQVDSVLCYMKGVERRRKVTERRKTGRSSCGATSACKYEWLRSSGGKSLPGMLAVTKRKGFFVAREGSSSRSTHENSYY